MANEHGEWIMYGVSESDPGCIKSPDELIDCVNEIGFLPLFRNSVPGFSVEERSQAQYWWSGHPLLDPWEWRVACSRSGKVAYGSFFDKKAGFISLDWLPVFANWRRDGYDFDSLCDEGLASIRQRKIMALFSGGGEMFSFQVKKEAGFGSGGEKNFDGTLTELEMRTYLVVKDFRKRKNKYGEGYGWDIAVLSTPEDIWGDEAVRKCYGEDPSESKEKIYSRVRELFPRADAEQINKILKG